MIIDILLYIVSIILGSIGSLIVFVSNGWSIWPDAVLQGFKYFFTHLMDFNIILPVDTFLLVISTVIKFDVAYISTKLVLKLVNWIRGAGGIDI